MLPWVVRTRNSMNVTLRWAWMAAAMCLMACAGVSCQTNPTPPAVMPAKSAKVEQPPAPPREFRGVWVATVGNIDWPSKPGLSTQQQQAEAIAILDRCSELNLNAVILQVRTTADA